MQFSFSTLSPPPETGALREFREFASSQLLPPPPKGASVTMNRTWACWGTSCPTTRLLTDFVG